MRRTALFAFTIMICLGVACACTQAFAGERVTVTLEEINQKGYIPQWMVIGKFSAGVPGGFTGMVVAQRAQLSETDFLADQGGEAGIEPEVGMSHGRGGKSPAEWQKLSVNSGLIDLGDMYQGMPESTMYAAVYIAADRPSGLMLDLEALTGAAVWMNHKLVRRSPAGALGEVGKEKILVHLQSGLNVLLIKFGGLRYEARRRNPAAAPARDHRVRAIGVPGAFQGLGPVHARERRSHAAGGLHTHFPADQPAAHGLFPGQRQFPGHGIRRERGQQRRRAHWRYRSDNSERKAERRGFREVLPDAPHADHADPGPARSQEHGRAAAECDHHGQSAGPEGGLYPRSSR